MIIPMITPNRPRALPKISTTRILTKSVEFCASDKAALLPTTPTDMLQTQGDSQNDALCFCNAQYMASNAAKAKNLTHKID